MRHHPLNPMTDASLVRVLQRQSQGKVGLVPFAVVNEGAVAIAGELQKLAADGVRHAIVDAITDGHLYAIGEACAEMKLLTGGSGLALGLPENFRRKKFLNTIAAGELPRVNGHAAVLAGSCSAATQRQVAAFERQGESYKLDAFALAHDDAEIGRAVAWALSRLGTKPVLIYSTAAPGDIEKIQSSVGRERASTLVESAFGKIAQALVDNGVRRLVVAGGETSGAVVSALGVTGLRVGAEIDPGVPWTASLDEEPLALALKSGNFGADDFFEIGRAHV
mgnify:FL=1